MADPARLFAALARYRLWFAAAGSVALGLFAGVMLCTLVALLS